MAHTAGAAPTEEPGERVELRAALSCARRLCHRKGSIWIRLLVLPFHETGPP